MEAGLLLAGATQNQVKYGCEYGQHLGMAFQMVDDLLDVIGTEEALGKSVGKDVAEEKLTWIAIRGIEGHTRGRGTGNGLGGGCGSENRRRYEIFANPCTKHPEQSTIRDRIRALAPD